MNRSPQFIAAIVLISASAVAGSPAPPGTQSGEESAVLVVMDRYLTAISADDVRAIAALQTPEGMTY